MTTYTALLNLRVLTNSLGTGVGAAQGPPQQSFTTRIAYLAFLGAFGHLLPENLYHYLRDAAPLNESHIDWSLEHELSEHVQQRNPCSGLLRKKAHVRVCGELDSGTSGGRSRCARWRRALSQR